MSDRFRTARGWRRRLSWALLWLVSTLAVLGCMRVQGRFQYFSLQSQSLGGTHDYAVFLPRTWDRKTPLPLVLLLHGAGDDETSADRAQVVERLDAAIASGKLPPFVMIAPDGERGFWVNWHDGSFRYRDWVLKEVLPAVYARYPLVPAPQGLHLLGVSMGAGGGMQMWLQAPEAFASASLLSGPILDQQGTRTFLRRFISEEVIDRAFGTERDSSGKDPYQVLQSEADLRGSRLLFGAATRDHAPILPSNQDFHALLTKRGVPHTYVTFPGRHGWRAWARVFPYVLCKQLDPKCTLTPPE